ncbi:MAG: tubulin-like doman-containing protein [Anaerolineae bacterium]|nr:tubulin-like doman-containing protein [Anaerolineae bacterium]
MAGQPITTLLIGLGGSGAWTAIHVKRQLFDAYDNKIPDNVAIAVLDTAKTPIVGFGTSSSVRTEGKGIGRTQLEPREYAHVGGDVYQLARDIDSQPDRYPHIASWFLSSEYLSALPRAQFALDEGAGQFRQFGRLALFRDVMTPSTSVIAAIVDNKLRQLNLSQKPDSPSISVIITGSLTGGTGAGLFLDVAHLVRCVAKQSNINITLRGFFYLPQAFKRTLNPTELEPARGRAFAALRELKRFLMNEDYQYGYPMYYHGPNSGVNQALWRAVNDGKLYDFVYLIDGEGKAKMNTRKLESGSASVVADAITAFIDENYGAQQKQYDANIRSKVSVRQTEIGKQAFVSTLGAYSIILPIQQIVEGWAHQLCKEMLNSILPAREVSERGYVTALAWDKNPDQGGRSAADEVRRLLTSLTPILDPKDSSNRRQFMPTNLWKQTYAIYSDASTNEQAALRKLANYDLRAWLDIFVPQDNDPTVVSLRRETDRILSDQASEHAQTSDQRDGGNPAVDWQDIKSRTDRFISLQLGNPTSGGGRQGGQYNNALDRFVAFQVQRFREYMSAFLYRELNGSDRSDAISGKTGKLGWHLAVMTEMRQVFALAGEILDKLRAGLSANRNQRATLEQNLTDSLRVMQEEREKRGILGLARSAAVAAQRAYIDTVQEYVNFYRAEFARDALARAIGQIRQTLEDLLEEFDIWRRVLATDTDSLHNELLDGLQTVRSDRQAANDLENHRVISDPSWENARYDQYVRTENALLKLFEAWEWTTEVSKVDGRDKISLGVRMRGSEPMRRDVGKGKWSEHNLSILLEMARSVFRAAVRQESVLDYLMNHQYRDTPSDLAVELAEKSDFLLSFNVSSQTSGYIPGNILLARFDSTRPEQAAYLREVIRELAARKGQGDTRGQDTPMQQFVQCADPFRLTLLSTAELIPLEAIDAYEDCYQKYKATAWDARQKGHIFPAEVRAATYEKDLEKSLRQPFRLLTDRVVLLLENESRFLEFLFMLTHGIVSKREISESGVIKLYWTVIAPDPDARYKRMLEWRLTAETRDEPSVLDAAVRYIIIGTDERNAANPIPYEHVAKYLKTTQEAQTAERIERDEIALNDEELRGWFEAFLPPLLEDGTEDLSNWTQQDDDAYLETATLIVRHDMMQELVAELRELLPQMEKEVREVRQGIRSGEAHDRALRSQEELDFYSVAVIGLEKEIFKYRELIQRRYETRTGSKGRFIRR